MQRFFFCILLIAFFSCGVLAQEETQIGVRFIGANASIDRTVKHRSFGLGADTVINLGDHVSVHGTAQVLRLKIDPQCRRCPDQVSRLYEADGDLRVAPFSMSGVYFFGLGGANFQRLATPFGSQNFLYPTLGGGAGFSRYGNVTYKHGFPDISSPLAARFDEIGINGYLPVKKSKWRGRVGSRYRYYQLQNSQTNFSLFEVYVGAAHTVAEP